MDRFQSSLLNNWIKLFVEPVICIGNRCRIIIDACQFAATLNIFYVLNNLPAAIFSEGVGFLSFDTLCYRNWDRMKSSIFCGNQFIFLNMLFFHLFLFCHSHGNGYFYGDFVEVRNIFHAKIFS